MTETKYTGSTTQALKNIVKALNSIEPRKRGAVMNLAFLEADEPKPCPCHDSKAAEVPTGYVHDPGRPEQGTLSL